MEKIFQVQNYEVTVFKNLYPVKLQRDIITGDVIGHSFIGTKHYKNIPDIEILKDIIKQMKKILKEV